MKYMAKPSSARISSPPWSREDRQAVLGASRHAEMGWEWGAWRLSPPEVALGVPLVALLVDVLREVGVASDDLSEVDLALVDPVDLVGIGVVVQQVLVLVGENALVEERPRRGARSKDAVESCGADRGSCDGAGPRRRST